jgi:1,4-alpha-glucan branching enzyme
MTLPLIARTAPSELFSRALARRSRRDRARRAFALTAAVVALGAWYGGAALAPAHEQVTLVLYAPEADHVELAGSWNAWDRTRMTRSWDGTFRAVVDVRPGAYEYQFRVDGQWMADPRATVTRPDGFGAQNSVLLL